MIKFSLTAIYAVCFAVLICPAKQAWSAGTSTNLDVSVYSHIASFSSDDSQSYQIAKSTFLPDRYDDLGLSSYDSLDSNYNDKSCESYTLTSCPSGAKCERCPFNFKLFRIYACSDPYILSDGACTCPPAVSTNNPNDVCTKYCGSTCIEKTCTPSIDQTNCTNGEVSCDDGCGGTSRQCCIACTNKVTSKPSNAKFIYEDCTDGDGTHQIQTDWECTDGYHKNGETCEKDCIVNNCSGFDLTSCPEGSVCDSCTPTAANCSTETIKYKIIGCSNSNEVHLDNYWCDGALRCLLQ